MGVDKAVVTVAGTPLLSRVSSRLLTVFSDVVAIGPKRHVVGADRLSWIRDRDGFMDPMGAILTAFLKLDAEKLFVVALDMPEIHPPLVRYLCAVAQENREVDVVAPMVTTNGFEPLCAVYSRSAIPPLQELHDRGVRSLQAMGEVLRVRFVSKAEMEERGVWASRAFVNLNTPGELREFEEGLHD